MRASVPDLYEQPLKESVKKLEALAVKATSAQGWASKS
jgi:hypothetical protein